MARVGGVGLRVQDEARGKSEEKYLLNGGINDVESLAGREIASYLLAPAARVRERALGIIRAAGRRAR